jgi:beta-galactosidase
LFLDGKSLGEKAFRDTKDLHLEWKVPYRPGTLKAVAKRAGKAVCADSVSTAGSPAKITLKPDRPGIRADGLDLSHIRVEIADREGRLCPDADNTVIFRVTGAGSIAGVGNGNPVSHEPFKADRRKAFHGLALAVIRSSREPGGIWVTAESEGLEGARVFIAAE